MKFRLLPRDDNFYQYFHRQAGLILRASKLLVDQAASCNGIQEQHAAAIANLESEGDNVLHELFLRLNRTFIMPIDPEDIHLLATRLDDVLDGMEDVAYRLRAYCPKTRRTEVSTICSLVCGCAERIPAGIDALQARRDVSPVCHEIGEMERQVDNAVRNAIRELLSNERDAIEIMKIKEIFEFLESTADRCQDVADALETVMIKGA